MSEFVQIRKNGTQHKQISRTAWNLLAPDSKNDPDGPRGGGWVLEGIVAGNGVHQTVNKTNDPGFNKAAGAIATSFEPPELKQFREKAAAKDQPEQTGTAQETNASETEQPVENPDQVPIDPTGTKPEEGQGGKTVERVKEIVEGEPSKTTEQPAKVAPEKVKKGGKQKQKA